MPQQRGRHRVAAAFARDHVDLQAVAGEMGADVGARKFAVAAAARLRIDHQHVHRRRLREQRQRIVQRARGLAGRLPGDHRVPHRPLAGMLRRDRQQRAPGLEQQLREHPAHRRGIVRRQSLHAPEQGHVRMPRMQRRQLRRLGEQRFGEAHFVRDAFAGQAPAQFRDVRGAALQQRRMQVLQQCFGDAAAPRRRHRHRQAHRFQH